MPVSYADLYHTLDAALAIPLVRALTAVGLMLFSLVTRRSGKASSR